MKKLTDEWFRLKFESVQFPGGVKYEQLDPYTHSHTKMRFKCAAHGEFSKTSRYILKGIGCPTCSKENLRAVAAGRTSYLQSLSTKRLELIGDFDHNSRLLHRCKVCNLEFRVRKAAVDSGRGCPQCEGWVSPKTKSRYTDATYRKAVRSAHPNLRTKRNSFTFLKNTAIFKCETHGVFERKAADALRKGCPMCAKEKTRQVKLLDKAIWEQRIKDKHGDKVRVLGQYLGVAGNIRYRFKCYTCFNTWKAQLPSVAITGTGCPHCANHKKSKAGFRVKEFERDGVVFRVQGWEYQAITWLLDKKKNLKAEDILTESSSKIPVIRYKFGRRYRNYYPDLFIPKSNHLVEVKSSYTLGLTSTSRRSRRMWAQNQAKAKAAIAAGYKFVMMVMSENGSRYRLPTAWYDMPAEAVLRFVAMGNGDAVPECVARTISALSHASLNRLTREVAAESDRHKSKEA